MFLNVSGPDCDVTKDQTAAEETDWISSETFGELESLTQQN